MQFESLWDFVSLAIAISVGSVLSGWNIFNFMLPSNPVLVLGWCFTCFSIVSVPITFHGERKQELQTGDRISHMAWLPAVPGVTMLGFAYALLFGFAPPFQLGVSLFCFAFSSTVFAAIHPSPGRPLKVAVNMTFSISMAYFSWIFFAWTDFMWGLITTIGVWYLFSLPVLMEPTYLVLLRAYTAITLVLTRVYRTVLSGLTRIYRTTISGLTRIYNTLVSGFTKVYTVIKANSDNIAFGFPVVIGLWFGVLFLLDETCPVLLGLDIRNCFQGLAVGAISMGVLYFLESFTLNGNVSRRVKGPSVALIGRGLFILLLGVYLPEALVSLDLVAYYLLGALALSFLVIFFLNLAYGFKDAWRRSLTLTGVFMFPSISLGLFIFEGMYPIMAITIGAMLILLVEAPILESQIRAFFGALRAFGVWLGKIAITIGRAVKAFFARLGYINWIIFSTAFSVGVYWISYPFFSELLGMTPG
ncbi:MAG: hypothetical protein P1Q69_21130, partial [Candidatus Thorarchaeota archaeon]|nr:hypothetical protein [Candidatus Thorarchaeota archaeon]